MEVAGKISASLRSFSGIQAIMVGGSVARGYADAFSDLELLIYWKGAPDKKVQQDIIKALNLERRYPAMDIGYDNAFWIDGFPVDIWHKDLADEEGVIEKVIGGFSLDLGHSNVLDTLQSGVALHGAEVLQPWKERAALYPEELAVRFLDAYLPHFHLKQLLYAVERDNPSAFYSILSAIQSSLFLILLALNKSYFLNCHSNLTSWNSA
jgi:predicted nucleotidyltransferase